MAHFPPPRRDFVTASGVEVSALAAPPCRCRLPLRYWRHGPRFPAPSCLAAALFVGLLGLASAPASRAQALFGSPRDYSVGASPVALAVGDFNLDGRADLAVADALTDAVFVLLGAGGGQLTPAASVNTRGAATAIAAGDIDGDGHSDLVVACPSLDRVVVRLSNGDGTFRSATDPAAPPDLRCLLLVDMNGDARLDLVTGHAAPMSIGIRLGNGDGSFGTLLQYPAGLAPWILAAADLDGDSRPDLAATGLAGAGVSVLLNQGNGSLRAPGLFSASSASRGLALADLDGDGRPDLISGNTGSNTVTVRPGLGAGAFGEAADYAVGAGPAGLAVADVDGDGRPDLLVACSAANAVSVLLGGGDGSFHGRVDYPVGAAPIGLVTALFDSDSSEDFATANSGAGTASVLLARASGPRIAVAPQTLRFGSALVGVVDSLRLTIRDDGTEPLVISAIDSDSPQFVPVGSHSASLAPGDSLDLWVRYLRGVSGLHSGALSIVCNDPHSPEVTVPLEGTATLPPALELAPDSLAVTLASGDSTSRSLSIMNHGGGPLDWSLSAQGAAPGWISLAPQAGSVAPGTSAVVAVRVDASGLVAGYYRAVARLISNDPTRTVVDIPVALSVTGAPRIVAVPDRVEFGSAMEGVPDTAVVRIHNAGSADLNVGGVLVAGPQFSVLDPAPFTLAPAASRDLRLRYARSSAGEASGTLSVFSDDVAAPSLTIPLSGFTSGRPAISVSPDSIALALVSGDSTSRPLVIFNTGLGPLSYRLGNPPQFAPLRAMALTVDTIFTRGDPFPSGSASHTLGLAQLPGVVTGTEQLGTVLVLGDGGSEVDVGAVLAGAGYAPTYVPSVAGWNGSNPSPQGFSLVVLLDGVSYGSDMPAGGQAALLDYVAAGGGLVVMEWAAWEISNGRFQALAPLVPVTRASGATGVFGHLVVADHPVTAGVAATFHASSGVGLGVRNSGTVLVEFANGSPAVVAKGYGRGRLVYFAHAGNYFGFRPFLGGDMRRLLQNAAGWTSGSTWLSGEPASGEIPPGGSALVQVGISARTLPAGLYTDAVRITSNDPQRPLLGVPVRLAVSIAPILVVADTLPFGSRPVGVTDTVALRVRNGGSDRLDVTGMTLESADFTLLGATAFSLAVGQQREIPIRLVRGRAGGFVAPLVITSNDLARASATVVLAGSAYELPSALVVPDSMEFTLAAGDTASDSIRISNGGPGVLHHTVAFAGSPVPWLSFAPAAGVLEPGENQPVRVLADARALVAGTYETSLRIMTDDPAHPIWSIPVRVRVTGVPRAVAIPDRLEFGSDFLGRRRTLSVAVTNPGTDTLRVSSASATSIEIALSGGGSFAVAPGGEHTIAVEYLRSSAGVLRDTLSVTSNDQAQGRLAIPLSGEARETPAASVRPESLLVGIMAGEPGSAQLQIANLGRGSLNWSLATVPAGVEWLGVAPASGVTEPDSTTYVDISVDGAALVAGTYQVLLRCTTDDPLRPVTDVPVRVVVSGVPRIAVSPEALDFGRGFLGVRDSLRLRLTNIGTGALVVSAVDSDSPEFVVSGGGGAALSPGAVREVWVTYRRTSPDSVVATLSVTSDDPVTPVVAVPLRGSAVYAPSLTISPTGIDLIAVARDSASTTLSLDNAGPGELDYLLRVSGALAPWLRFVPDRGSVQAGGRREVAIRASAAALDAGVFQTTLQVVSNDPASPIVDLPVRFTVTGTPRLAVSPDTLRFGTIWVGHPVTLVATLTNTGTDSLRFTSAASTNPRFALLEPLPGALGPGRQATARVRFSPTGGGSQVGDLEVGSNDPAGPLARIRLEGAALEPPAASLSEAAVAFAMNQDDTSHARVWMRNLGSGALTFSGGSAVGWLRTAPVTATVPPLDSVGIDLRADAGGLGPGSFATTLQLATNDPARPLLTLPVQLGVQGIPPGVPASPTPADASTNVTMQPALRWAPAARATSYDLFLWRAVDPKPGSPTAAGLTSVSHTPAPLATGTSYRWQVVARNASGAAPGPEWGFTTERLADLSVPLVEVPTTAFSSQTIQVRWIVANGGDAPTNVPGWIDYVYLSTSLTFDPGNAILLGSAPNASYLAPGEEYAETGLFALPRGIDGSYHVFVRTDVGGALRERDEGNNTGRSADPIAVTLTPTPDLRVTAVSAPILVIGGDLITVGWTVRNSGIAATETGAWSDAIYLTTSPNFDLAGASPAAVIPRSGILDPGASYERSVSILTPRRVQGAYYVHVYTDVGNQVYEHVGEVNNSTRAAEPLQVQLAPPPDLVAQAVVAPATATAGSAIDVEWTDFNQGPGPTFENYWEDRVYISTSPQFDGSAIALGSLPNNSPLAPSAGRSRLRTITLPKGISGDWYVYVWADVNDHVFEHQWNSNNITRSAGPISVQLAPWPNLVPVSVTVPARVSAGSTMQVSWQVENRGVGGTPETYWRDDLYLSASPTWNPAQASLVGSFGRHSALPAGTSYSNLGGIAVPQGAQGTYYLYCVADGSSLVFEHVDEADNIARSAPFVVDPLPTPDLVAEVVEAPATAASGFPIGIVFAVRNDGGGDTRVSSWEDRVYLSTTPAWDPANSIQLGAYRRAGALSPGGRYTSSATPVVPNGVSGSRWLVVVTDAFSEAPEPNRTNNVAISPAPILVQLTPPPDLTVAAVSLPGSFTAGQPAHVSWQVENRGPGVTRPGEWYDAVYYSLDSKLDAGDPQVASVLHQGALQPGGIYAASAEILIPNYAGGAAYLLFRCSSRGEVFQLVTANDLAARPIDVIVPPPSDLVVTSITHPGGAIPGRPVTIAWTIRNVGANPARGWMWDAVYVSADATYDANDPRLPLVYRYIDLAPGASASFSAPIDVAQARIVTDLGQELTAPTPGLTPGAYHVIVRTDIRNSLRESDEGNNGLASTGTMDVDIAELTLGLPLVESLPAGEARYYKFRETAGNTAVVKLTGYWPGTANEVYVSFGRTPTLSEFDIGFDSPMSPNQDVVVPKTAEGTYYVLVQSRSASGSNIRVSAENLQLGLTGVSTHELGNGGPVTLVVEGALLDRIGAFGLRFADGLVRSASSVRIDDAATATVRFDLLGAAPGPAVLYASNPGQGLYAEYATPLSVLERGGPELAARITGPSDLRPGQIAMFSLEYGNAGYNDAYDALISVKIPRGVEVVMDRPGLSLIPHTLPAAPGEDYVEWIVATRLYARTFRSIPIAVRATGAGPMSFETVIMELLPFDSTASVAGPLAGRRPGFVLVPEADRQEGFAVFRESPAGGMPWSHVGIVVQIRDTDAPVPCIDGAPCPPGWYVIDAVNGYDRPDGSRETGIRPPVRYDDWLDPAKDGGGQYRGLVRPNGWSPTHAQTIRDLALAAARSEAADPTATSYWWNGAPNIPLPDLAPLPGGPYSQEAAERVTRAGISLFTTSGQFGDYNCIGFVERLYDQAGIGQIRQHPLYPPGIYFEDLTGQPWVRNATVKEFLVFSPELVRRAPGEIVETWKQSAVMTEEAVKTGLRAMWDGTQAAGRWFKDSWGDVRRWYQRNNREFRDRWRTFDDWYADLVSGRSVWRFVVRMAVDPNDIVGPEGVNARRWVANTQTLAYAIRFENDSTVADAAVQSLTITQPIDPGLELRSFRLGSFGFGPWTWQVPENRSYYSTRLDLRDSLGLYVDVVAGLDVIQRRAFWNLRAIDPGTGEPPANALAGFIPPNDAAQRGQGFVSYTIRAADSTLSGTRVEALARIVFDTNDPVDTPPVFNTVDAAPPESRVLPLPAYLGFTSFTVAWTGRDAGDGSGLASYDVYVQRDYGPFEPWLTSTSDTSAVFTGVMGSSYAFYSVARDSTGLAEAAPQAPDATTTLNLATPTALTLVSVEADAEKVRVTWAAGSPAFSATLYRATRAGEWSAITALTSDGSGRLVHVDTDVTPGERYGYRLGVLEASRESYLGETWVDVPRPVLALYGALPNPATSELSVSFSLPSRGPATLEAFDVAGRCVASRSVGHLGPGRQRIQLGAGKPVEPGVYILRLSAGNRRLTAKVAVLR